MQLPVIVLPGGVILGRALTSSLSLQNAASDPSTQAGTNVKVKAYKWVVLLEQERSSRHVCYR